MIEENLFIIYLFALFVAAFKGRIKNPIDKTISSFSLTFKVKKQSSRIKDYLLIEELSNDPNRINFTYKKIIIGFIITLFLVAMTWILPSLHHPLLTIISVGCAIGSLPYSHSTVHLLDTVLEAEKLYKQKQQFGFKKYPSPAECLKKFRESSNKEILADLDTSVFLNRRE